MPKYFGLGYGQSYGESSKAAMKLIETVPKRSFIAGPLPQKCEDCIQEECNSLKHHSHDVGVQKHILEPESCGNSDSLEESNSVPKGATSSFVSPPHEAIKVKAVGTNLVLNTLLLIL